MEVYQAFLFLLVAVGASAATAPDPNGTNVIAAPRLCPDDWFYEYAAGLCYKVCPGDWFYEYAAGLCYKPLNGTFTWMDGQAACADIGGGLVSIPNRFVNFMIMGMALSMQTFIEYVAIGYRRPDADTQPGEHGPLWFWTDGSKSNFTFWQRENPNVAPWENCAFMQVRTDDGWKIGRWTNAWCYYGDHISGVVCQRAANSQQ